MSVFQQKIGTKKKKQDKMTYIWDEKIETVWRGLRCQISQKKTSKSASTGMFKELMPVIHTKVKEAMMTVCHQTGNKNTVIRL